MKPKVLILRAAGINCDKETAWAFESAGAASEFVHINRLVENPKIIDQYQAFALSGGFSYGDDIASGRVLANQLQLHLKEALHNLIARQGLILGICNGFQVLVKSGLLGDHQVTLTHNTSGRYLDCWVKLQATSNHCRFISENDELYLPIAHAEGRFMAKSKSTLESLQKNDQLALVYQQTNPNGSEADVAGLTDMTGQIFGLMPHPERFLRFENHPHWTRLANKEQRKEGDGFLIFKNAVNYLKGD